MKQNNLFILIVCYVFLVTGLSGCTNKEESELHDHEHDHTHSGHVHGEGEDHDHDHEGHVHGEGEDHDHEHLEHEHHDEHDHDHQHDDHHDHGPEGEHDTNEYSDHVDEEHTHADGSVHTNDAHIDNQIDAQGRSHHVHADGSIHYSETSESRVSGNIVKIPANEITKYGIGLSNAGPGKLQMKITLSGEIAINTDNMAHIVPRVPGIVREVKAKLGDLVKKGDVLAIVDSRDLADAKSDYLANLERLNLGQTNFNRMEKLWQNKISAEKVYLNSRQNLAEAKINLRTAKQKLIAMGFTNAYLESLPQEADEAFTRYEVVAPFNGTVIEKHIALGEDLKDDAEVFIIADLSTVWINLQVYPKDLHLIHKGQHISLQDNEGVPETHGIIDYVGPLVGTQTRTTVARVVQPNPKGELRPGLFVNADVVIKNVDVDILVHNEHIQYVDDVPCVFTKVAEGFEIKGVTLGDSDGEYYAITNGLKAGEKYATTNSFLLKAEMEKSLIGFHVHSDGTVHIVK